MNTLKQRHPSALAPTRWRNLGIIAHVDAGKTTLTERLLWKTGAIHRMGEVHDGLATTDFSPIERARGITIGAAAVQALWSPRGAPDAVHRLTLIDTPGHVDFAIEVERSLRVLDGAVLVFSAVDGVQPQSESVWRQARRHGVPLLAFVNKMDRVGASYPRVLAQMRAQLGAQPWSLGLPIGAEDRLEGWVDWVACTQVRWDAQGHASVRPWTAAEAAEHAPARLQLIAQVAEHDAALAEAYLADQPVSPEDLRAAIRRGTLAGAGVPVLAGSAFRTLGIDTLLDAIVDYLPSPPDRPAVHAAGPSDALALPADPAGPLAALVFKITHREHAPLAYVRVYSGTLRVGDTVWSSQLQGTRRIGRLAVVQADRTLDVAVAQAGEIVAVLGWKDAASGESLSAPGLPLRLDSIRAQPAVLAWRLEATQSDTLIRLGQGLASLAQEDPSFRVQTDADTGETLVWGMGELHLEVMVERLRSEWNVAVRTGALRVAYQETPRTAVHGVKGAVRKQGGGPGQYARVVIELLPRADGEFQFTDLSTGGALPRAYVAATEKGIRAALAEGPRGWPLVGLEVRLLDGGFHPVDSSDLAFQRAGAEALRSALAHTGTVLLEPVMALAVDTPAGHVGEVIGDLQRRQGKVLAVEDQGARVDLRAQAPLARLAGYTTTLRSLTQGRATAHMAFERYEAVRDVG